ncbi:MAG: alpha-amylase [Phycisphaeraceae bacterium]|nr:alpha-amylase [Phycisphaeraceae bacterium]
MAAICFYFQMHQPLRLRRYSVFDTASDYFDESINRQIIHKVTHKCYLPLLSLLRKLVDETSGRFACSLSVTAALLDQLQRYEPTVVHRMVELAETGRCEFLNETSHHSLAYFHSRDEFLHQVETHALMIEDVFGQRPRVFRNTELVYHNEMAAFIAEHTDCRGILTEGVDHLLAGRSPNHIYTPPGIGQMALLLRHYKLSDDIAFRFSNHNWPGFPLTADKYVSWLADAGEVVNLFMDMETFGEHQWKETGIFDFMAYLPRTALAAGHGFVTVGEAIDSFEPAGEYDAPRTISWADTERDLSAWAGNAMQVGALTELYKLEPQVKATRDRRLIADWRNLTTSDHFYYMCTKYFADGEVHRYFNPYESPYDSYINYMNVLDHLRTRAAAAAVTAKK